MIAASNIAHFLNHLTWQGTVALCAFFALLGVIAYFLARYE